MAFGNFWQVRRRVSDALLLIMQNIGPLVQEMCFAAIEYFGNQLFY